MFNTTHDPTLRSWVPSANGHPEFPIQNLPLGVFQRGTSAPRIGVAIGNQMLDLRACTEAGVLPADLAEACRAPVLNPLLALGRPALSTLRQCLSTILRADHTACHALLVAQSEATMLLPMTIGDYTDAYASIHHASRVGALFRPEQPLLPNYTHVPIAYHGRSSSIVVSGAEITRPHGQLGGAAGEPPQFGPCAQLDYELEVGAVIAGGNTLGAPVALRNAHAQIAGFVLVNDWSARDIQRWEYQPLGPFLGKNFATSISPWLVTCDALVPFQVPAAPRRPEDAPVLPYLQNPEDIASGAFDITLDVFLRTEWMRAGNQPPMHICRSNLNSLYWTFGQIIAHHTSNGCNLRPGDLVASGTVSGAADDARGCLLELTRGGREPLQLPSGEIRRFLENGDEITIHGFCERAGYARIGLGNCVGVVRGT